MAGWLSALTDFAEDQDLGHSTQKVAHNFL